MKACPGIRLVLLLVCLGLPLLAQAERPQPLLPTIELQVGSQPLSVELATTSQQRYMGLSFRTTLADDAGMLFVYQQEQPLTYTMRNTLLPLSIAFISADRVINEIHLMNPGPGQRFPSRKPAMYALEVNQGWFRRHGLKPGDRLEMR